MDTKTGELFYTHKPDDLIEFFNDKRTLEVIEQKNLIEDMIRVWNKLGTARKVNAFIRMVNMFKGGQVVNYEKQN